MALWGDLSNGIGMPEGYSGLTPDQAAMVQQLGYYMRPDAVQPGAVAGQAGDATQPGNAALPGDWSTRAEAPEQSLWEKLKSGLADGVPTDLQKTLDQIGAPPKALGSAPPATPLHYPAAMNPYFNIFRRSSVDPRTALKALLGGGLY